MHITAWCSYIYVLLLINKHTHTHTLNRLNFSPFKVPIVWKICHISVLDDRHWTTVMNSPDKVLCPIILVVMLMFSPPLNLLYCSLWFPWSWQEKVDTHMNLIWPLAKYVAIKFSIKKSYVDCWDMDIQSFYTVLILLTKTMKELSVNDSCYSPCLDV